jgi:hypothetical protein
MGQGVDLSEIDDQTLSSHLQIASALVNSHCSVPTDFDFRGGTVTGEDHEWKTGNYMWPGSEVVYPKHPPLRTLTEFKIYVSNVHYLNVDVNQVHYHESENKLEPVMAAASLGVWTVSAIPVAGFREPSAHISYEYGHIYDATDEQMFNDGGKRWRGQNQWWDSTTPPVIKVKGNVIDDQYLTYDYDEGTVEIDDDALTALDVAWDEVDYVTGTYKYKLPTNIGLATSIITTSLLGQQAIAAKGLQGLSGLRVEEVEIRQSRDAQLARDQIPGNADILLVPFKRFSWGA